MSKKKLSKEKHDALKTCGALNPNCEKVKEPIFWEHDFFDPNDLVQVKYEMLRLVQKEGATIKEASKKFGFSRIFFYQIQNAYNKSGLIGLIPKKHGPKRSHKLSEKVMEFIVEAIEKDHSLNSQDLSSMVAEKFDFSIHPRSIERALERMKKKRKRKK